MGSPDCCRLLSDREKSHRRMVGERSLEVNIAGPASGTRAGRESDAARRVAATAAARPQRARDSPPRVPVELIFW
jgi:hypothetical protein